LRIPRDVSGQYLVKRLAKSGYQVTRQTGSHIRLTRISKEEHHLTIPNHPSLKIGTLNAILNSLSSHLKIDKKKLIEELFGK